MPEVTHPPVRPATESMIRAEQLINELLNDSEIGSTIRAKAKTKYPDVRFPEDTLKPVLDEFKSKNEALEKQLKEVAEKLATREKEDAEAKTFSQLQNAVDRACKEYALTEEGRNKMLERMKETGNVTDVDAAAAWVASKAPPAQVPGPTWATKSMDLFGSQNRDEKFAALHKNPEQFLENELVEFAKDPDKYAREAA